MISLQLSWQIIQLVKVKVVKHQTCASESIVNDRANFPLKILKKNTRNNRCHARYMKIEEFIEVDKETGTQNLFYCWYSVHLQFFFLGHIRKFI